MSKVEYMKYMFSTRRNKIGGDVKLNDQEISKSECFQYLGKNEWSD